MYGLGEACVVLVVVGAQAGNDVGGSDVERQRLSTEPRTFTRTQSSRLLSIAPSPP